VLDGTTAELDELGDNPRIPLDPRRLESKLASALVLELELALETTDPELRLALLVTVPEVAADVELVGWITEVGRPVVEPTEVEVKLEPVLLVGSNKSDKPLPRLDSRLPDDEVDEVEEVEAAAELVTEEAAEVTSLAGTVVGLAAAVVAARVLDWADPVTVWMLPSGAT
jgi:hypothetical protein